MCSPFNALAPDYDSLPHAAATPLELDPLALDAGEPPHAEDAFLAELRAWLRSSQTSHAELSVCTDLARDALDLVDGLEGAWQELSVEAWFAQCVLYAAHQSLRAAQLRRLAGDFVAWLGHDARLSLHAQRLLQRRIAATRIEIEPRTVVAERALAA